MSIYYLSALCSELFTSVNKKSQQGGERSMIRLEQGEGEALKSARSRACGPATGKAKQELAGRCLGGGGAGGVQADKGTKGLGRV